MDIQLQDLLKLEELISAISVRWLSQNATIFFAILAYKELSRHVTASARFVLQVLGLMTSSLFTSEMKSRMYLCGSRGRATGLEVMKLHMYYINNIHRPADISKDDHIWFWVFNCIVSMKLLVLGLERGSHFLNLFLFHSIYDFPPSILSAPRNWIRKSSACRDWNESSYFNTGLGEWIILWCEIPPQFQSACMN